MALSMALLNASERIDWMKVRTSGNNETFGHLENGLNAPTPADHTRKRKSTLRGFPIVSQFRHSSAVGDLCSLEGVRKWEGVEHLDWILCGNDSN